MQTSQPRKVAVVHNSVKTQNNPHWHDLIEKKCREYCGVTPVFFPTTADDHGQGLACKAVDEGAELVLALGGDGTCLLYTSPSPRDRTRSRMPSSA